MPIPGTQTVTAKIAPSGTSDTYPTHDSQYGQGGFMEVGTILQRNNIPVERRRTGMLVYVRDEDKYYTLFGSTSNTGWRDQQLRVYRIVDTLISRDNIPSGYRTEGMEVYVVATGKSYRLVGGTSNVNWQEVQTSGGYHVTASWTTLNSLDTSNIPIGAVYTTQDDGRAYWWDGSAWFPLTGVGEFHTAASLSSINGLPSHLKRDGELFFTKDTRHFYRMDGTTPNRVFPNHVRTFTELQTALSSPTQTTIVLTEDITISASITIPANKQIFFNGYKFIKGPGSPKITFLGSVVDGRVQIFQQTITPPASDPNNTPPTITGWTYGDIIGSFGGRPIYPEWWSKYPAANYDDGIANGYDDVPIQCAVLTCGLNVGQTARFFNTVSLKSAGLYGNHQDAYFISRMINARECLTSIVGESQAGVYVHTTKNWLWADYFSSYYHSARVDTGSGWGGSGGANQLFPNTLTAAFAIGSQGSAANKWGDFWGQEISGQKHSMNQRLENMDIRCLEAAKIGLQHEAAHPGDPAEVRRFCGVHLNWGEENCYVKNLTIQNYTGFGVGLPGDSHDAATTNGFRVESCWILDGAKRDAVGIYIAANSPNVLITNCTVSNASSTGSKQHSQYWNVATPGVNFLYTKGQPVASDTVTIGSTVYTFVSGSPSAGQVQIGATLQNTIDNLEAAINGTDGVNTAHATVTASQHTVKYGFWLRILSKATGSSGNGISCSVSNTSNQLWEYSSTQLGSNAFPSAPNNYDFYQLVEAPIHCIVVGGRSVRIVNTHTEGGVIPIYIPAAGNSTTRNVSIEGVTCHYVRDWYQRWHGHSSGNSNAFDTENMLPPVIPSKSELISMATTDYPYYINPAPANNNNNGASYLMLSAAVCIGPIYAGVGSYGNQDSTGIATASNTNMAVTIRNLSAHSQNTHVVPKVMVRDDNAGVFQAAKLSRSADTYNAKTGFYCRGSMFAPTDIYPWDTLTSRITDPYAKVFFLGPFT